MNASGYDDVGPHAPQRNDAIGLLVAKEFNRQIFGGTSMTIGDAILAAKRATNDKDVRRSWILFGDPTLRLK